MSPLIIISAIVLIIVILILSSYKKRGKMVRNDITGKDETIFSTGETRSIKYKPTLSIQPFPKNTSIKAVCQYCRGTKKITCKFCHGIGSTKTNRFDPPTTIRIPKVRTVFDAKGRATYQHYSETQVRPGKMESINRPCGTCMGFGKVKCPHC